MQFERFFLGVVAWLPLAVVMVESGSLDNAINTQLGELTEQMAKISGELIKQSGQLSKLSEQQTKLSEQQQVQSDQLSRLSEQQTTLSEQQSQTTGEVSKLTKQMTELADQQAATNTADDDTKIDVIGKIQELEQKMQATSSGPVFVRWGRKTCNGTGSETVYTGVTGGSPAGDAGGSADLLCLPRDPSYANHNNDNDPAGGIFVAEYILDSDTNFPFEHNDPLLREEDVPCAMCQVTNGSSVMMIPARVDCYSDWKLEYRGYLMNEHFDNHRVQFICVDANPETDYGGSGNAPKSVHLYAVETYCDYLPCPPFENFAETSCVVCSK